ncbi:hypothetical protein GE191_12275 [Serratia fonticola]|uniref:hypothetical protein n=1 Tax=Serratia fonticola TaxID=47917 RepID=UPI0013768860|nr:hypothetical protein [Serratia fonticola]NBJ34459.1 hypothetical protein [Serratia fonticola]
MEWISIEEREPEVNQDIWVMTEKGVVACKYAGDRKVINVGSGFVGIRRDEIEIRQWRPV